MVNDAAIVQLCIHNEVVAVTVARRHEKVTDALEWFETSVADWVANQWRFEIWDVERVRNSPWCDLHGVAVDA